MEQPVAVFDLEKALRAILSEISTGSNVGGSWVKKCIFDLLLEKFETWSARPVSTLGEMKRRDNKTFKGTAWEQFCQFYLTNVMHYDNAWLWHEVPDDIRLKLKLASKVDNGIDIVCIRRNGRDGDIISAVQCKYRKKITQTVTWTTLSTFVGLCSLTGPWHEHIVMTNCKGVSRKTGIPRGPKDRTIAYGTFKNLTRTQCMFEQPHHNNNTTTATRTEQPKSVEELRAIRLAKFT